MIRKLIAVGPISVPNMFCTAQWSFVNLNI